MSNSKKALNSLQPNKARGEIAVEIAGKTLILNPSFKRVAKVEAGLGGRSLIDLGANMATGALPSVTELALIFSLLCRTPKMTQTEVGDLLLKSGTLGTLPALEKLLKRVLTGQVEDDEDEEGDDDDDGEGEGETGDPDEGNGEGDGEENPA